VPPQKAAGANDELQPPTRRTGLPDQVRRDRERQAAVDEIDRRRYEPAIRANIAAHRIALDALAKTHQILADEYDFDVVGDTRQAAVWQMAGRCIGISRLICDALELGYTADVMHLARALHEADRLLFVFTVPEETKLLRRWLTGEYVKPQHVRTAELRFEKNLARTMREAGLPTLKRTDALTLEIYDQHSAAAHHRRRWTQDAVTPALRTMIRGRTDSWLRRAGTTAALLAVVEEGVQAVGDGLSSFVGPGWYEESVKPLLEGFAAVRLAHALP
jgi:hypothetical protein